MPSPATLHPMAIISRWPIGRKSVHGFGVHINVPAGAGDSAISLWVFTAHLPYTPYQPYQVNNIPYHDAPFLRTAEEVVESAQKTRGAHVRRLIDDVKESCAPGDFVCLTGDFNEPSHHDWTDSAALAGVHPIQCKWPTTHAIETQTGLVVRSSRPSWRPCSHYLSSGHVRFAAFR